jgi:hypothetical protein
MKQQAVDFHGYAPAEVRVAAHRSGTCTSRKGRSRRARRSSVRSAPTRAQARHLTTTPRELYPHHDHVLRVLIQAMTTNAWREPAQVLVRLHPRDERDALRRVRGCAARHHREAVPLDGQSR